MRADHGPGVLFRSQNFFDLFEDCHIGGHARVSIPDSLSKQYSDHVYALDKALYGLKQAPRAWYDVLSQFLIESGFQKGSIDTTLFIKKKGKHIISCMMSLRQKSTSGSVQFLGDKLVCWSSKKQNCVSISTAESEYVTVSGYCAQVLWMRTQLIDYSFFYDKVPIYCDSKSAIAISCNPVHHTRTKHIDVRTGIDLPRSLPSHLGKLGLGDGV
nr:Gag-Pol polyprotein [Tanacetum cinerariifolium]